MNRLHLLLAMLLGATMLSSCRLPRHHTEVMHGHVRGGKIPLYKTGSIGEFFRAGLILPDVGGYVRAEFDVLDVGGGSKKEPVAQVAIPRLVSSFDLSRSSNQMRAALPASDDPVKVPYRAPEGRMVDSMMASVMDEAKSAPVALACSGPECRPTGPSMPMVASAPAVPRVVASKAPAPLAPSRAVHEVQSAGLVIAAVQSEPKVASISSLNSAWSSRPIGPAPSQAASRAVMQSRLWATNSYFQVVNMP